MTEIVLPIHNEKPTQAKDESKKKGQEDKKKEEESPKITFKEMLRFATRFDWFLMIIGGIAAMGNGIAFPMFSLVFG